MTVAVKVASVEDSQPAPAAWAAPLAEPAALAAARATAPPALPAPPVAPENEPPPGRALPQPAPAFLRSFSFFLRSGISAAGAP